MPQDAPAANVPNPVQSRPGVAPSRESLELGTLQARRAELSGQLGSIQGRRALLVDQMRQLPVDSRTEFAERIRLQDGRAARLETEMNAVEDQIAALIARGVAPPPSGFDRLMQGAFNAPPTPTIAVTRVPSDPFQSEWGILFGGMVLMQGLTLVLLGVVVWRSFVRRTIGRLTGEDATRLEQLQRSVDVMAVEVERISESQRFTAKMLNDQVAEPVRVGKDAERIR
jgi:hypothetical protein